MLQTHNNNGTIHSSFGAIPAQAKGMNLGQLAQQWITAKRDVTAPGRCVYGGGMAVVYAACKAKADALASLPLMISRADDQVMESGPLVELAEQPAPTVTARAFWRATSIYMDIWGRAHWRLTRDTLGRVIEVMPLNPMLMTAKVDRQTGELIGWTYRPPGATRSVEEHLTLNDVHTILDPDYENVAEPHEGLGVRQAAALAISQHYQADVANAYSLRTGASGGLGLRTEHELSEHQRRELSNALEDNHAGVKGRHKWILLEGGIEPFELGSTFTDMEFAELKKMSRTDICAALNVPPAVVGYYEESNYAHADAAMRMFWVNTIIPRAAWFASEWQRAVLRGYENDRSLRTVEARTATPNVMQRCTPNMRSARASARRNNARFYAWFDSSSVPAVQAAMLEQADMGGKWIEKGVPLADVIDAFDLPFPVRDWQKTWCKQIGMIDVQEENPFGNLDAPAPTPGSAPGDDERMAKRKLPGGHERVSESTLANVWNKWRRSWAALQRTAESKLKKHWFELREITLANLDKAGPQLAGVAGKSFIETRDVIGTILFDLQTANGSILAKVGRLMREAARLGGEQSMHEAADAKAPGSEPSPFNISDPTVQAKLRARDIKLADVNVTMRKRIANSLADGLHKGETTAQLSDRIKHEFNVAGNRSANIARTEVGAAVEEARHEGRKQAGVPMKSWLSSRKQSSRGNHLTLEQQTHDTPIANDALFTLPESGETCSHPRDASLSPGESINCSCTVLARYPEDSLAKTLTRLEARGFLTYEQLMQRDAQRKAETR